MNEDRIVFWGVMLAGALAMIFAEPVKPADTVAVTQAKEAANTAAKARVICPKGMRIRATMSQSIWNAGGWPLWRVTMIKTLVILAVWFCVGAIVAMLFGRSVPKDRPGLPRGRRTKP